MSKFSLTDFGEGTFGTLEHPDTVRSERVAWTFSDGTTIYEMEVNPNAATMPSIERTITQRATTAGRQVIYEGKPTVKNLNFSGVILEEAQYRSMLEWSNKHKQIRIKDDLDDVYWVYLMNFQPKRVRKNDHDWYMEYSVEGVVLDRGAI